MDKYSYIANAHGNYIDELFKSYQNDPESIDESWKKFFEGFEFAGSAQQDGPGEGQHISADVKKEFDVLSLIYGFRTRGHLLSDTNPIRQRKDRKAHLNLTAKRLDQLHGIR